MTDRNWKRVERFSGQDAHIQRVPLAALVPNALSKVSASGESAMMSYGLRLVFSRCKRTIGAHPTRSSSIHNLLPAQWFCVLCALRSQSPFSCPRL